VVAAAAAAAAAAAVPAVHFASCAYTGTDRPAVRRSRSSWSKSCRGSTAVPVAGQPPSTSTSSTRRTSYGYRNGPGGKK
jgi:hypothetical protein